jgi:hypothetical protein
MTNDVRKARARTGMAMRARLTGFAAIGDLAGRTLRLRHP